MKVICGILASLTIAFLFITGSTTITSCKKTVTVHDTTVVRDTVCDCESGMVAKYTFTNGSLADSSGYGNNISFNSATATTDRNGVANGAFLFNGTSSYMRVPNDLDLNPTNITLFAIIKVNGFYQGECHANNILSKGTPDDISGFYALRYTDSTHTCPGAPQASKEVFYGEFGNNIPKGADAGAQARSIVATGQWYKIAFTYDGREARFYVNGVLADKRSKTVAFTPNSSDIYIGKHNSAQFPYFINGVLDELQDLQPRNLRRRHKDAFKQIIPQLLFE